MTRPKSQRARTPQTLPAAASGDSDKAREVSEYIGRELRSMFDGVVAEPVPEKFLELLEALEKKQSKD